MARLGGLALPQQLCMEPLLDSSHGAERKAGRVEREALRQARQRCCVDLGVISVLLCLPARLPSNGNRCLLMSVSQCQRESGGGCGCGGFVSVIRLAAAMELVRRAGAR